MRSVDLRSTSGTNLNPPLNVTYYAQWPTDSDTNKLILKYENTTFDSGNVGSFNVTTSDVPFFFLLPENRSVPHTHVYVTLLDDSDCLISTVVAQYCPNRCQAFNFPNFANFTGESRKETGVNPLVQFQPQPPPPTPCPPPPTCPVPTPAPTVPPPPNPGVDCPTKAPTRLTDATVWDHLVFSLLVLACFLIVVSLVVSVRDSKH